MFTFSRRSTALLVIVVLLALAGSAAGTAWAASRINGATIKLRSVPGNRLKVRAVGPAELRSLAVTTPKLRNFSVTAPKVRTGAITSPKLASGAVTADKLAAGAVGAAALADGSVSSATIADGAITRADIAAGVLPIAQFGSFSGTLTLNGTNQALARTNAATYAGGRWIVTLNYRNAMVSSTGNWSCDFYVAKDGAAATLFEVGGTSMSVQDRMLRQLELKVPDAGASYEFELQCTSTGAWKVGSAGLTVSSVLVA